MMLRKITCWISLLLIILSGGAAFGHDPMASWAVARLSPNSLELRVTLAAETARFFIDSPGGNISPETLQIIKSRARNVYQVSAAGKTLVARTANAEMIEEDAVEFRLVYPRPARGPLRFNASYLKKLTAEHRAILTVLDQEGELLFSGLPTVTNTVLDVALPANGLAPAPSRTTEEKTPPSEPSEAATPAVEKAPAAPTPAATVAPVATPLTKKTPGAPTPTPSPSPTPPVAAETPTTTETDVAPELPPEAADPPAPIIAQQGSSFWVFLKLGVEHILTGYDHLLFLGALLVVCRRFSSIVAIITCFTLAHSLTLALAALNLVTISGRLVEPLIAASIVFVGVENLARREEPKNRRALTFAFGLIHGFGFAGVLRQIGLGTTASSLLVPLFSFNLGVELGQIAVTAIVLPVLWKLRSVPKFARYGIPAISVVVALMGAYWLVERVFFS